MVRHNIKLFVIFSFFVSTAFSAVGTEDSKLMEELTGRSAAKTAVPTKALSLAGKHLQQGQQAFQSKNYIQALKHYNTILVKHRTSKEVTATYLAKAQLYREMGVSSAAQLNQQLAEASQKSIK